MLYIVLGLVLAAVTAETPSFVVTERELTPFVVTDRPPPPPEPEPARPPPPVKSTRPVVKVYTALPLPGKQHSWCAPCDQFHEAWDLWLRSFDSPFDIQWVDADKMSDSEWPSWNPDRMIPAYEWQDAKRTRYIIGKQEPLTLVQRWRLTQK